MTTYPSVRPAVGADDRLTWSAPRRTTQARSLQTNACALVSCQNSFAVLSNVRRSTSTLAQSSSMLRAPLPATSRPQSRLAAARQQHTARLHCAGRATGADRCRQPSTVRAAVHGLLAVLLTLGKLGAAATALTADQPPACRRRHECTWNRTLSCAVPRALMAATTRGGLGVSRSSPGPQRGPIPITASRGIQFLYPKIAHRE